ncbi:hypothetical protein [Lyngbya sp. PCC 8106]|uniref:hypothetical protein n=1 Tax=Lyngbya sp. (strain PCC 8106) TaxID=313612 RepID=UPI0000EAC7FD|nr:hypothetical protein [Lyngbya sp. PCC 8106]EAW38713.1 hypothetical protein L8106_14900 [Lyngbya sp. PCC 8106]
MVEPKDEKLTHSLNLLIEEHGLKSVIQGLASHCQKEAEFLKKDRSTDLAQNWQKAGESLQSIIDSWGS